MQESARKTTLVPIRRVARDLPKDTRVDLTRDIFFENVEGLLKPENFELWRGYVSEDARQKLSQASFALLHRFRSSAHVGLAEQKSTELMKRVFICLRLIKPTQTRWS